MTRLFIWISVIISLLAMAASAGGVFGEAYAADSSNLAAQAMGQDGVNLFLAYPFMLVLTVLIARGSVRAYMLWLGMLIYSAYSYLIYATSLHFSGWFLAHVGIIAMSVWVLAGGIVMVDPERFRSVFQKQARVRLPGLVLLSSAALFFVVWLSEIIPSALAGEQLESARMAGLTTNPVYVVDLGFLLPAMVITGILLLRRHTTGFLLTPGLLIFGAVFGLAVTGKFVSMAIQGEPFDIMVVVLMSRVVLVFLVVLVVFLKDSRSDVSLDEVLKDRQALSAGSPE